MEIQARLGDPRDLAPTPPNTRMATPRSPRGASGPEEPEDAKSARAEVSSDLGRYMGLGLQFAASVALLTFAGYWLDGRANTLPWFTVLGVLLGFVGATISLVHHVPPVRGRRSDDSSDHP